MMAFILLYQYNRQSVSRGEIISSLIHNVNSARVLILNHPDQFKEGIIYLDLFGEEKDSVEVKRTFWGLIDIWKVRSNQQNQFLEKIYLTGQRLGEDKTAIYLENNNKPLALCGRTIIKGNAKLSRQGVKRAYIEGQNFIGADLIQGAVSYSDDGLPPMDEKLKERLNSWKNGYGLGDKAQLLKSLYELRTHKGTPDSLLYLESDKKISLSGVNQAKWTIFKSAVSINLSSGTSLENCILIAPQINIGRGFKGTIQCFATGGIDVQKDVELNYPSGLCLLPQTSKTVLRIEEGAKIKGGVLISSESNLSQRDWSMLYLEKGSEVVGDVFVDGKIDIRGEVKGKVVTRMFYLRTPSSIYENHLLNVTIDREALSNEFVKVLPLGEENKLEVIECLR